MRRILGTSKLSGVQALKTTIIKDVVEALNLKQGDKIVYIKEDDKVIIEKA